jgi:hypothetical protein
MNVLAARDTKSPVLPLAVSFSAYRHLLKQRSTQGTSVHMLEMRSVATINVYDRADEFRFEILGKFAGSCVSDVAVRWTAELPDSFHRKFTVDISGMTGYDLDGRKLLREMHRHGTQFACGTPQSLTFFREISATLKQSGVTLIRNPGEPSRKASDAEKNDSWGAFRRAR